jgi:hypothetical protein
LLFIALLPASFLFLDDLATLGFVIFTLITPKVEMVPRVVIVFALIFATVTIAGSPFLNPTQYEMQIHR